MMIKQQIVLLLLFINGFLYGQTANPQFFRGLTESPTLKGSSFACFVQDADSKEIRCQYQAGLQLTPASVMKLITTATAIELLGSDYRYPTTICYDGTLKDGILNGNLYIKGSGDPTLGSAHFAPESEEFLNTWINAIRAKGIRAIHGRIIADESIFDTEGVSPKWVFEDLGSYYGAGSYGLSVFDNQYQLALRSSAPGEKPRILACSPEKAVGTFHNYLKAATVNKDSSYIVGAPFSDERFLYGVVPANRERYLLKGDIPEPALFLARYLKAGLIRQQIEVTGEATCFRRLQEAGEWEKRPRTEIVTTYSPELAEIIRVTNHVSHNLYADALVKTIGLKYREKPQETISSFNKGIQVLRKYWEKRGIDLSGLYMYDGSGLAPTGKLTASLLGQILTEIYQSPNRDTFYRSLPVAGESGSVRNFLKGSPLQGKARLKSGSMSRVKAYAGYIRWQGHTYSVAVLVNQYNGSGSRANREIRKILEELFHG